MLSIGLTGGLLTASAYVATRSLWLPLDVHFAWDCTHSGIFGVALSARPRRPTACCTPRCPARPCCQVARSDRRRA
jgi:membrane protease YdiL (CAAX protease family)